MAVFIWQKDALDLMAQVEFPEFDSPRDSKVRHQLVEGFKIEKLFPHPDDDVSFIGALRHFAKPDANRDPSNIVYKIYGDGGLFRWLVSGDGEIHFSHYQARHRPECVPLSEKLGFTNW